MHRTANHLRRTAPGRLGLPGLLVILLGLQPVLAPDLAAQEPADEPADELGLPDDPFVLPDIVVTATRVAIDRERISTQVTVFSGDVLREQGVRTVADALRQVPGMAVARTGSEGGQTALFLRGGESNYVQVLIDGVPVNQAGGSIDLADLSTHQVERIEVVRGPASVLYGSDAVTGVVQIFTTRGRGEPTYEVSLLGGRGQERAADEGFDVGGYNLMELDGEVSGSTGSLSYAVGGGRSWTEGAYPMNNERTLHTANARIGWTATEDTEVGVSARFTDSDTGLPTDGAGNLVREHQTLDRRMWTTALDAVHRPAERLELRLQLGRTEQSQVTADEVGDPDAGLFPQRFSWDAARTTGDLRMSVELPRSVLTVGGGHEVSTGSSENEFQFAADGDPETTGASHERSNTSGYLEVVGEPVAGLTLTGGGRMDHNETFGRFDTYRVGVSWAAPGELRLRGAAGRAFREPTFAENFGSGGGDIGNADLVPERTRSWELGLARAIGPVSLSATWFDQRFRDMIQFTFVTEEPDDPNYVNVGAAAASGIELGAAGEVGPVGLTGTFTFLDTEVLDPGLATDETFVEGEALLRRPARSGSVTARMPLEGGAVGATVNVVGERADLDFAAGWPAPRITLPRHVTVDVSGEYALPFDTGPRTRLLLRVENLFDRDYQSVAGFPDPGRIVRVGLSVGGSLGR